jgi:hypothetical protein
VVILQNALDTERISGRPPGTGIAAGPTDASSTATVKENEA